MATPAETRWTIEPHTQIKHLILRRYLDAWLPIMARYNDRILFVDGFAGPGRYSGGEPGSPVIALEALLDHPHFTKSPVLHEVVFKFIECEADRAAALRDEIRSLKERRPIPKWVNVDVLEGEFAPLITKELDRLEKEGKRLAPTFAFIDPFGFKGVPLAVIARLMGNPHCECLITFMYEAIGRFIEHPELGIRKLFDQLFATEDVAALVRDPNPTTRRNRIVDLYREQLLKQASLRYIRTFEMIDRGNHTEYFLYFGTSNLQGLSKMKQAMWKADPGGGRVFSDLTVADQMVLFASNPDLEPLRRILRDRFRGQGWIEIDRIEEVVLVDTPYSEAIHLKRRTLAPMERARPQIIQVKRLPGSRNRPGDYPAGTKIKFV